MSKGLERQAVRRFPELPWEAVWDRSPAALRRALPTMLLEELVHRGAPRDLDVARDFLRRSLPPGELLVHGAGTHTAALLEQLASLPGIRLVGVVDKYAAKFDGFHGLPVFTPEDARSLRFDRILLSNELWEEAMRSSLVEAGVGTERIRSIYADPRYETLTEGVSERALAELPEPGSHPYVIVDFVRDNQRVVGDETLERVLPAARTVRLFSERHRVAQGPFRSHGFRHSHRLLLEMLRRLRPRAVYLRTFTEDNPVGALVRRFLPEVALFHELYDWGLTIEPRFLREVYGHCERSIERVLTCELASLRTSTFVVTKRGGSEWERVTEECGGEHASYFPQLVAAAGPSVKSGEARPLRLVYAGNLPEPKTLDIDMVGALFPLFRKLAAAADVEISVFNGSHRSSQDDDRFAPYAREATDRIRYQGARPYEEIVRENARNDYGWMYFPRREIDFIDEPVLISNKFTGYVSAGLPVLIDDGWTYMASLVREFDAGVVVPMREPDELIRCLTRVDPARHRRGMLALRAHLLKHNEDVVDRLGDAVAALGASDPGKNEGGGRIAPAGRPSLA